MTPAFDPSLAARIEAAGIVAVVVIDRAEDAIRLARALLAGGITVLELTLRTPAAIEALRAIKAEIPELIAGAGTVVSPDQLCAARDAGAAFGVAPGTNARILSAAREFGLPFAPGVATPSDIETALEHGCRLLKFFPAEPSGGLPYLRAIAAPYAHFGLKFIPLGGLAETHLAAWLDDPLVAALGGSWIAPRELIAAGDWPEITARASRTTAAVQTTATRRRA